MKSPECVRIVSIDPSSTCMGVSVFDVNIVRREKFKLLYMNTIFGDKLLYDIPDQFNDLADTGILSRSYGLARSMATLLQIYEPDSGIIEDNFLGKNPSTFKQLIQAVYLLREAFVTAGVHVSYVTPRPAKAIVGADFQGSQKEDVHKGVMEYKWLDAGDIDLSLVDQHSADSGAIGLYRCEQIAKHYGVYPDEQLQRK
ncbi:Holliday junction resolvase [compost metagenome]